MQASVNKIFGIHLFTPNLPDYFHSTQEPNNYYHQVLSPTFYYYKKIIKKKLKT